MKINTMTDTIGRAIINAAYATAVRNDISKDTFEPLKEDLVRYREVLDSYSSGHYDNLDTLKEETYAMFNRCQEFFKKNRK